MALRIRGLLHHLQPTGTPENQDEVLQEGIVSAAILGRLAALLFMMGGATGLIVNLTVAPKGQPLQLVILSPIALLVGAIGWVIPWERFPSAATIAPVAIAMVMISFAATAGLDPYSYGAFFTLIFAWLGITQRRGIAAIFAVPAAIAYSLPIVWIDGTQKEIISVFTVIPVCVVVGESLAWISHRLRDARHELRSALSVKEDFVALTTHELNTPIASILGFVSTMIERPDAFTAEQRLEFLKIIERNTQSLRRMVANLVALSEKHSEVTALTIAMIEARPFIERIISENYAEHLSKFEVKIPEHFSFLADAERTKIILMSFISNTLQYGAPPVVIQSTMDEFKVEISVSDMGEGIPDWFTPNLFKKFSQTSTGTTRTAKGLGIGLSLAKSLAEVQGGEVWYRPNSPTGSVFGVSLPRLRLEDQTHKPLG